MAEQYDDLLKRIQELEAIVNGKINANKLNGRWVSDDVPTEDQVVVWDDQKKEFGFLSEVVRALNASQASVDEGDFLSFDLYYGSTLAGRLWYDSAWGNLILQRMSVGSIVLNVANETDHVIGYDAGGGREFFRLDGQGGLVLPVNTSIGNPASNYVTIWTTSSLIQAKNSAGTKIPFDHAAHAATHLAGGVDALSLSKLDLVIPTTNTGMGLVIENYASDTLSYGSAVSLYTSNGRWSLAHAGASQSYRWPCVGFSLGAYSSGTMAKVLIKGVMYNSGWSLSPGLDVYLSNASYGAVTHTAPTTSGHIISPVGQALGSKVLLVNPTPIYMERA